MNATENISKRIDELLEVNGNFERNDRQKTKPTRSITEVIDIATMVEVPPNEDR